MAMYSLQLSAPFLQRWSSSPPSSNNATVPPDQNAHSHPRKSAHCSQKVALNISTNVIRPPIHLHSGKHAKHHPHLRVSSSKKATATVSLSSATASATSALLPSPDGLPECVPTNSIPFPSAPIELPSPRDDFVNDADDEFQPQTMSCDTKDSKDASTSERKNGSHVNLRRKRAKSCLASTYVHNDGSKHSRRSSTPHPLVRFAVNVPTSEPSQSASPPLGKRARLCSTSTPKLSKRARRTRKLVADLEFTSMLHRSLDRHLRLLIVSNNGIDENMDASGSSRGVSLEQDFLLVERLWRALVDQGYKPQDASPTNFVTDMGDLDGSESPFLEHNESLLTSPSTIPDHKDAGEIMTISQLIASLILRANDRRSTRPRSSRNKSSALGKTSRLHTRSPLHQVVTETDADEPDDIEL
ncbi:hypothetical protein QCA50_017330 [Cerrena zonata]|uniref:Uncharacterized protein n=1 Tax=Cerrena zonata TaxID=2478898 RepID=A0AAW0FJA2_9APHY